MSNRIRNIVALLVVLGLAVGISGCKLLHEKTLDIVFRNWAAMEFQEREDSANYVGDPKLVDVADDLDDALASVDPPLERSDITDARLLAATYEVTWLEDHGHDWELTGKIWMQYGRAESVIVNLTSESLYHALGAGEIHADLNQSGVNLFNQALEDYRMGLDPVLSFWVENDDCVPAPSSQDSLKFDWTGRLYMYVISPIHPEVIDLFE